jgi:uncharacterized membrane protein YbaN (DUF454 family)
MNNTDPAISTGITVWKKVKEVFLIIAGLIFVGLEIIGIFLPLLPTTVFFLLAAVCFAHSSKKFYDWLLNNKWFGSYIKDYREKKGVSAKVKIVSLSFLWITILSSAIFAVNNLYVRIGLIAIAIAVSIHIMSLRTLSRKAR